MKYIEDNSLLVTLPSFMLDYQAVNGVPPTIQEMTDNFNKKSATSIQRALYELEKAGAVIRQKKYTHRSWTAIDQVEIVPNNSTYLARKLESLIRDYLHSGDCCYGRLKDFADYLKSTTNKEKNL